MPSMAALTVKKFDGVTDIVYDILTSSGGEGIPAVWRQDTGNTAGLPVGLRSQMSLATKWNGNKSARQALFNIAFPYAVQDSTTTLYSAKDRVVFSGVVTLPVGIPASWLNEAAYQGGNLLSSLLIKQSLAAGYSPT